ncbi:hypothetical protein LTR08_003330 [Meristemomyces frigidus]|nr:hypothetical protein LTR08_003330 [Meristemomyces frigidus]
MGPAKCPPVRHELKFYHPNPTNENTTATSTQPPQPPTHAANYTNPNPPEPIIHPHPPTPPSPQTLAHRYAALLRERDAMVAEMEHIGRAEMERFHARLESVERAIEAAVEEERVRWAEIAG